MVLRAGRKVCVALPSILGPVIYVAVCVWPRYSMAMRSVRGSGIVAAIGWGLTEEKQKK